MASLAYYLVLFLYLHACTAGLLLESDKQAHDDHPQLPSKDVKASYIAKASGRGLSINKFSSVQERDQNIGGKKVEVSYSWKILSLATGLEISKRAERSMLESSASKAEGNVSNKDEEKTEEIDVMDYAQPHRKPPIHNKGT